MRRGAVALLCIVGVGGLLDGRRSLAAATPPPPIGEKAKLPAVPDGAKWAEWPSAAAGWYSLTQARDFAHEKLANLLGHQAGSFDAKDIGMLSRQQAKIFTMELQVFSCS